MEAVSEDMMNKFFKLVGTMKWPTEVAAVEKMLRQQRNSTSFIEEFLALTVR